MCVLLLVDPLLNQDTPRQIKYTVYLGISREFQWQEKAFTVRVLLTCTSDL